ncbi:hypothetical protein SOPP22_16515 [Shewanella sp. OPT22]|nr:hypothetical protein SOPP22_16515 [Shewanella sp. OPT22]
MKKLATIAFITLAFNSGLALAAQNPSAQSVDSILSVADTCSLVPTAPGSSTFTCKAYDHDKHIAGNSSVKVDFTGMVEASGAFPGIQCHFRNAHPKASSSNGYEITNVPSSDHSFYIKKAKNESQGSSYVANVTFYEGIDNPIKYIFIDSCKTI